MLRIHGRDRLPNPGAQNGWANGVPPDAQSPRDRWQPGWVAQVAGSAGRRRPGIVCGMDDTTETQLRAAQQKVDLAAAKLARAIVARDRIIKTTVAAGATRYAVAKVTGLTQPAVKKAVDRT